MLKTKNTAYNAFVVILIILSIVALILNAAAMVNGEENLPVQICCLFNIAALIYAAYYIFSGFSKDAAKYFKAFGVIFALALVAALAAADGYLMTLLAALSLSAVIILTFGKDMGKKASFIACGILLVLTVLFYIASLSSNAAFAVRSMTVTGIVLSLLLGVMIYAKYADKAQRGSK